MTGNPISRAASRAVSKSTAFRLFGTGIQCSIMVFLNSSRLSAISMLSIPDRKSTRLNSSHLVISYAVFCLKKRSAVLPRANRVVARVLRDVAPLLRRDLPILGGDVAVPDADAAGRRAPLLCPRGRRALIDT